MLDRPSPPSRRAAARARHKAWRARARRGEAVAPVVVGFDVLHLLIDLGWLGERESADRAEVGRAIAALLADTAKCRR